MAAAEPASAATSKTEASEGYSIDAEAPPTASSAAPSVKPATPASNKVSAPVVPPETPASPTPAARAASEPVPLPAADPLVDPLVAQLQAMFTSLDRETIQDVLASRGGNADAAVPTLLELTGGAAPDTPRQSVDAARPRMTQEQSDAEYARRLVAEEHEATARYGQLNYQPRQRRPGGPTAGVGGNLEQPEGQGNDEFQQAINTVKEAAGNAGRVAQSWFSKASAFAKDKYSEFEQQRAQKAGANVSQDESSSFNLPSSNADRPARTPETPAVSSTPRTAPSLPHGSRYARPSNPPKGFAAASPAAQPSLQPPMKPEDTPRERISLVNNTRERTAEDSDDEEDLEYTRSPFDDRD